MNDFIPPIFNRKASAVAKAIVQMFNGQPAFTPKNFESLAKEGFENNVWVYRCITAIAQAVAGVDWVLYQGRGKTQKELEEHALIKLLYKPNEFESKQEFFERLTAFLMLSGNSYIEKVGPNVGPPMELYALRPDRIKVVPDPVNFIGGYEYTLGAKVVPFPANKIMHIKSFHATDDLYGLSAISVAAKGIDNDNAASTWNNSLLNNSARPSGAMVTESHLGDDQYNRLKDEINVNYKGASKAGKFMLLEGGLKWVEMGLSPKDMDFILSKKMSRIEICAAFGVPPEIVGDKEHATYSNYQEARQAFYQETVLPILDLIRDKLNAGLVPLFGENLHLNYDRDGIEALQESREKVWARAMDAFKAGVIMKNETRQAVGYETVEGGNVFYEPTNIIPVGPDAPEAPEIAEEDEDGGGGEGKKNFFLKV
jgi:HK97 family phage portal protein